MKNPTLTVLGSALIVAAVLTQSCNKKDRVTAPAAGPVVMTTDFQSGFAGSNVQFFIDDWQAFSKTLTTTRGDGLAHTLESNLQSGRHRVRVIVDGVHRKDTTLELQRNLYLGVNLNEDEIRFLVSDARWAYE